MKMNKIIIPAAMLAVGVALVGSISSTLAWYQYSTKAQAAYIGTSVGQSENLEIQKKDGKWAGNLPSAEVEKLAGADVTPKNLIPVTPGIAAANGNLGKDDALPEVANFKNSIETGVEGYGETRGLIATNVVQFTLNIHYKQVDSQVSYKAKKLQLADLTIMDNSTAPSTKGDLYKAIRVHISAGDSHRLYANNGKVADETITTATYGFLDTINSGTDGSGDPIYDKKQGYEWETQSQQNVMYGIENSQQVAYNTAYRSGNLNNLNWEIGELPAAEAGLAVTVTIWIEGWQKLSAVPQGNADRVGESPESAMWDPQAYSNKKFNVGMRFQAVDIQ